MKISYFGDSHINAIKALDPQLTKEAYVRREHQFLFDGDDITVRFFGSASATGLINPNSATGVSSSVPGFIKSDLEAGTRRFVFHFGKVDMDFVLPFKSVGRYVNPYTFIERSVSAYEQFLTGIKDTLPADAEIIVLGLMPPPLQANEMLSFVKNEAIMKDVSSKTGDLSPVTIPSDEDIMRAIAPRSVRTSLCLRYNADLQSAAERISASFADPAPRLINAVNGELDDIFRFGIDHHLDAHKVCRLLFDLTAR